MRIIVQILYLILIICTSGCAQKVNQQYQYLSQNPPSKKAEIFAPGIISKPDVSEFGSIFNKDLTEFYFGVDIDGKAEIRFAELVGGRWSEPRTILSHKEFGFNDPFLSPNENRLYFISNAGGSKKPSNGKYDIWYVEKEGNSWSEPVNAGPHINSRENEYYMSFSSNGTMYFSSNKMDSSNGKNNFDIYYSKQVDGKYQPAELMSSAINTRYYEADVFVDPDEEYVIFCARRPEGLGRGDLYISFNNFDGTWTDSKNMGEEVNTRKHELCPFVTKDRKYLFFTSNQDIYWVSTGIIDDLKATK